VLAVLVSVAPQATKAKAIASARSRDSAFFIAFSSYKLC
jgi:hypothetical protein